MYFMLHFRNAKSDAFKIAEVETETSQSYVAVPKRSRPALGFEIGQLAMPPRALRAPLQQQ